MATVPNNAVFGQNADVDATAEQLVTTTANTWMLTGIRIYNPNASGTVYVGNSSGLTTSNGVPVAAGGAESFDAGLFGGDASNVWVIGSTTNLVVAYCYY